MRRALVSEPHWGLTWQFRRTTAHRVNTEAKFVRVVPEVEDSLSWRTPLEFCITEGPRVPAFLPLPSPRLATRPTTSMSVWNAWTGSAALPSGGGPKTLNVDLYLTFRLSVNLSLM